MFRGRNTESGQFHQPSDGSHTDEVHGRGVRAPFRVARYKQHTDDRSQWHSSGHHGGLPLGTSGGLCQEEETEYDGKHAGDESLFVY